MEEKDQSIIELNNDKGVCKTAPATLGLLKSLLVPLLTLENIFLFKKKYLK